jgi:hypothetical protein
VSALNTATAAFHDGSAGTAAVSTALNNLASSSVDSACSQTAIRGLVADFASACGAEIQSDSSTQKLYDTLFSIPPTRKAYITKDDSGRYCAVQVPKASDGTVAGGMTPANVQKYLGSASSPNATTIAQSNAEFLFINPNSDATTLCTTCTKNIMNEWTSYLSDTTYAPSLAKALLFAGESAILSAIQSKCPSNFLTSTGVQAAGAAAGGLTAGLKDAATVSHANVLVVSFGALFATLFAMVL